MVEQLRADLVARDARIEELSAEVEQLHAMMDSRAVIDQAMGVLMSTMRIGPDTAFAVLAGESNRANRKLREIAEEIVNAQQDPSASPDAGPQSGP